MVMCCRGNTSSDPAGSVSGVADLTERERDILTFERQWWKYAGAKEAAIRDLFDLSGTRYYQVLNDLIDRPEAMMYDGQLVHRLRRMREQRRRARASA